jgi:hypothetical protein
LLMAGACSLLHMHVTLARTRMFAIHRVSAVCDVNSWGQRHDSYGASFISFAPVDIIKSWLVGFGIKFW